MASALKAGRVSRRALRWLIGALVLLCLLRIAGPFVATWAVNRQLADLGAFSGRIDDLDFVLWRGAYRIEGLSIVKRNGQVPVPFFDAERIDLSVRWRELLQGRLVAEVSFSRPELNFVDARRDAQAQSGKGVDWRAALQGLFPIRIDHMQVHEGTVHFRNFGSEPPVSLSLREIEGQVTQLANRSASAEEVARLEATATALGGAPVQLSAQFAPLPNQRDFTLRARVDEVAVTELNDFARAYARVDLAEGTATVMVDLQARDGQLDGLIKPVFQDLQIFEFRELGDKLGEPHRIGWEITSELLLRVFSNWPRDQFAACIPIQGDLQQRDVALWPALRSVLRNAFVEAFERDFEGDCPAVSELPDPLRQGISVDNESRGAGPAVFVDRCRQCWPGVPAATGG